MSEHTILSVDDDLADMAQDVFWEDGLLRAAGAMDVLLAAICLYHEASTVHYDRDDDHIRSVVLGVRRALGGTGPNVTRQRWRAVGARARSGYRAQVGRESGG